MLSLHVWGSAFGLPSIDAECLAAIAYLHNALPSLDWRLIPSNDPAVSPFNFLPALNHDGVWTRGYRSIVNYLTSNSLGDDLDQNLSPIRKADTISYGAFIGAHAAALVDLSLYVSATNWVATTRPAYSTLLPFPLTWTIPTLIRAEAIKRVEHLGLAELDTDFDPNGGLHLTAGRDALPDTFRRHLPMRSKKLTVKEEMTPEQASAIRLCGLSEDCLTVLDHLLSSGREGYEDAEKTSPRAFPGTAISSLDCLAFGHLALMIKPPVPRPFVREWLESKTPRLRSFVDDMIATHILARGDLPWSNPDAVTPISFGGRILDSLVRHIPGLGEYYAADMRSRAEQGIKGRDSRSLMLIAGVLATGVAAGVGITKYHAMQPFGAVTQIWRPRMISRLGEYGELGSMLSSALGPLPTTGGGDIYARGGGASETGRLVEIDSEVD